MVVGWGDNGVMGASTRSAGIETVKPVKKVSDRVVERGGWGGELVKEMYWPRVG